MGFYKNYPWHGQPCWVCKQEMRVGDNVAEDEDGVHAHVDCELTRKVNVEEAVRHASVPELCAVCRRDFKDWEMKYAHYIGAGEWVHDRECWVVHIEARYPEFFEE